MNGLFLCSNVNYTNFKEESNIMKKKNYTVRINASIENVFNSMLGLTSRQDYEKWTAAFNPTSTYEGSWNTGDRIRFIGVGENGEKGGMVSEIVQNIPNKFVSIRHLGILKGDEEILNGPDVDGWKGLLENYKFEESNGSTLVTVETDIIQEYEDYFDKTWPIALRKLKEINE